MNKQETINYIMKKRKITFGEQKKYGMDVKLNILNQDDNIIGHIFLANHGENVFLPNGKCIPLTQDELKTIQIALLKTTFN